MLSRKKLFGILEVLATLLILGLMVMSLVAKQEIQALLTTEASTYGFLFIFIISGLLEIIPQLISPHFILLNAAILQLPLFTSFIIITLGSATGSIMGFELGIKYGLSWTRNIYGTEKINTIREGINARGKWIITIAAVSPIPYIPIIFGALGMKRKTFLLYGVLPRIISFTAIWLLLMFSIEIPIF